MGGMQRLAAYIRYLLRRPPSWKACSKASCWQGSNAGTRHMNILSPHFTDGEFKARVRWAEKRGCNCLHLFLVNQHDGEGSGFTALDPATADVMDRRLRWAAKRGLGLVLWCMSDDSREWARSLDMDALMRQCRKRGWLRLCSTVVVGLEVDEYWSRAQVAAHIAAIRRHYRGKVGIHHSHGTGWADLADILFYQCDPGKTAAQITYETRRALGCGKPVNFFELSRHEDRALAEAALSSGAFGVGNW